MSSVVVARRGGIVEAVHRVHAAVVDGDGRLTASVGDPEHVVVYRSAAKPFQAVPLVEDGVVERFGFTTEELALCCASHNSEPAHIEAAGSILEKAGLVEGDLECGPHLPYDERAANQLLRAGEEPRPIHNNCCGKRRHVGSGQGSLLAHSGIHPSRPPGAEEDARRDRSMDGTRRRGDRTWAGRVWGSLFRHPCLATCLRLREVGGYGGAANRDRASHDRPPVYGRRDGPLRDGSW